MTSGFFTRWEGIPMQPMNDMNQLKNTVSPRVPQQRPYDLGPDDLPRYRAGRISFIVLVVLVLAIVIGVVLLAKGVGN